MVDWYLVSVLVFAGIVAVLVYLDRKKWKRESILLMRKTQRGRKFLIRLGTRFPRLWLAIGTIAVIVTFISSIWIIWLLIVQTQLLATGQIEVGPGLLVPSPTNQAAIGPGYFAVPFWYWIISIAVLVIVHEGSHGLMSAREKVRIKSLGWGLLAVIPLAFVEPDEKQLRRQKPWKQLRVFAAGSFANFAVAALAVALIAVTSAAFFIPSGVGYQALIKGYPAAQANLTGTITGIDNYAITGMASLEKALQEIGPNQTITLTAKNGSQSVTFVMQTFAEPEPDFSPDLQAVFLIKTEQVLPGTVDFLKSSGNLFSYITGSYKEPDWASLTSEIKFWEYAKTYPGLEEEADLKIAALESELDTHPRSGFIGILGVFNSTKLKPGLENYSEAINFIQGLLFFMFLINFGVGMFNMLPIGPLDGGRMWEIVLARISRKHHKKILKILSWAVLLIILADFALVLV